MGRAGTPNGARPTGHAQRERTPGSFRAGGPVWCVCLSTYLAPTISFVFSVGVFSRPPTAGLVSDPAFLRRSSPAPSLRASSSRPRSLRV